MGVNLPSTGLVYVDTPVLIYAVERHPRYASLLLPLWESARENKIQIASSELALLEVLAVPIRNGDKALQQDYGQVFVFPTWISFL